MSWAILGFAPLFVFVEQDVMRMAASAIAV